MKFLYDNWSAVLLVLSVAVNVLQVIAAKTKNKVDDAVVDVIADGVNRLPKDPPAK